MLLAAAVVAAVVDVIFGPFGPTQFGFGFFLSQSLSLSHTLTHSWFIHLLPSSAGILAVYSVIFGLVFLFFFVFLLLRVQLLHHRSVPHFVCFFFFFLLADRLFRVFGLFAFPSLFTLHFSF